MKTTVKVEVDVEERKKILIVYAGRFNGSYRYFEVEKIDSPHNPFVLTDRSCLFSKTLFKNKSIGSVYEVETASGYTYSLSTQPAVGYLNYTDKLVEWEALDKAYGLVEKDKEFSKKQYEKALDPIREAYQRAHGIGKQALIAQVIQYICK